MRNYSKYSGAGNDFLILEDWEEDFPLDLIPKLCERRLGVGADGLILARKSEIADFQMVYFNADGSSAAMCGNGLRCFVHFLRDQGHVKHSYKIQVFEKVLTVKCEGTKIGTFLPIPPKNFREVAKGYLVDTGVPHLVIFTEDEVDVEQLGRKLRNDPMFQPEGVNVNFVSIVGPGELKVRTYERGVERETLACGTGAAAAAWIAHQLGFCGKRIRVIPRSNEAIEVEIGKEIKVTGPSIKVTEGFVEEACTNC